MIPSAAAAQMMPERRAPAKPSKLTYEVHAARKRRCTTDALGKGQGCVRGEKIVANAWASAWVNAWANAWASAWANAWASGAQGASVCVCVRDAPATEVAAAEGC